MTATQACLEARTALEVWLASGERTRNRLEDLIRHWCGVYARDEAYTAQALKEATRLAESYLRK